MLFLIVGATAMARAVAERVLHGGHEIRVLDADAAALERLPVPLRSRATQGDPLLYECLAEAAARCDAIAVITADDAVNAVVAHAARRRLRVPRAVASVANPRRAEALHGSGVQVVCPTMHATGELERALLGSPLEIATVIAGHACVFRAPVTGRLAGRRVSELDQPGALAVVGLARGGRALLAAPELTLAEGDELFIAALDERRLREVVQA